jgi:hypothetical protein
MMRSAIWTMPLFALLLTGCSQTVPASECDGWRKLTPSAETRAFVIAQDRPFAEQVAAHNTFGTKRGCWK